ncbi:VOC family protein [Microbacterium horticulturae]|uniref:VOC family protein n=1 Tax=Microbacterium horticulturae TaxID=3028316 RepID=A0ABY8BW29_9MICO|nr:VOC family protein [Microbacterium sp. KACC 23027]WEG08067.1 VOC family protein [Microbacterium sp. KACC 23027]
MTALTPYLHVPGTAREALTFYRSVFGGEVGINTYAEFGRDDGPGDAVAHGMLTGPVTLFAADAAPGQEPLRTAGLMFALLGTAEPDVMEGWFAALADGGTVVDPLQKRPWGDHDGQVTDRYGLTWLIGYQG